MSAKVLRRSRHNRMIAGVVGGAAEYLGMDPTVARVLYVVGRFCPPPFRGSSCT
ncbi:MAG: PspC domain-containing protein [Phycisphaerales bacterium]|nr:PspC domain-containing protein [Phycisphaerales bacterium]